MTAEHGNPLEAEVSNYIQKNGMSVGGEVYDNPIEFGIALAREIARFDEMNVEQISKKVVINPDCFALWLKYIEISSAIIEMHDNNDSARIVPNEQVGKKKHIALARIITTHATQATLEAF